MAISHNQLMEQIAATVSDSAADDSGIAVSQSRLVGAGDNIAAALATRASKPLKRSLSRG